MAMWVCRAGINAKFFNLFIDLKAIFLTWEGFDVNLSAFTEKDELRALVMSQRNTENRTSVSNWTGQLLSFLRGMQCEEYVLIPNRGSREYSLARIVGDYSYRKFTNVELFHSRDIELLQHCIPRTEFDQDIVYSLGAYRTLFKVKHEQRVMDIIEKYCSAACL